MAVRDMRAAKRYATALFATAKSAGKLDAVEADIRSAGEIIAGNAKLSELWESRVMPAGKKRDILTKIFEGNVDVLTLSFLRLLIDKRREEILPGVLHEMRELVDGANRLVRAEATFAVEPTKEEMDALILSLEKRTGEKVQLSKHVDASILGGVIVRMHDTIIDGSVRGTLDKLREQLLSEA